MTLTAEELLAGSALNHTISIPSDLLTGNGYSVANTEVVIRPLTVRDLQRISKAAHDDDNLSAALMIVQAMVEPNLKLDQVTQLPAGIARFLVEQINTISGVNTPRSTLEAMVQVPFLTPLAATISTTSFDTSWKVGIHPRDCSSISF